LHFLLSRKQTLAVFFTVVTSLALFALQETDAGRPKRCDLPHHEGSGWSGLTRFYWDTKTGKCEDFKWGGKGGNSNNFKSYHECKMKCATPKSTGACEQDSKPTAITRCSQAKRSWYHNKQSGQCTIFWWTGCDKNKPKSVFDKKEQCEQKCGTTNLRSRPEQSLGSRPEQSVQSRPEQSLGSRPEQSRRSRPEQSRRSRPEQSLRSRLARYRKGRYNQWK